MPLVGPWTDSTGTGHTYPNAYLVAHERIDTDKQTVLIDITIYASSAMIGHHPVYQKVAVPSAAQITTVVNWIEGQADLAIKSKAAFSGMSTTG